MQGLWYGYVIAQDVGRADPSAGGKNDTATAQTGGGFIVTANITTNRRADSTATGKLKHNFTVRVG